MSNITIIDYKEAIKIQYEIAKKEDVLGILSDPTPAQLRDSYIRIFDKGLTKADEEIMRAFFETKENESLKKSIENCNIGKLKPIIHFLKGMKSPEDRVRIELAAILVDFNERPYKKYSKSEEVGGIGKIEEGENVARSEGKIKKTKEKVEEENDIIKLSIKDWIVKNKYQLICLFFGIALPVFFVTKYMTNDNQCMEWQNDHYETVDCKTESNSFTNLTTKVPLVENMLNFKKIEVCDTTTFFKNSKPMLWYCKKGEQLEFFNAPGFHPENNKPLRPITQYMIDKYLK